MESSVKFRRTMAFGIAIASALILLFVGCWYWCLRDGLGPDSIESSGFEAWRRFSSDFWPVAAFCLVLFGIAFFIAARQAPTRNASTNAIGR